jgi:hypothetical protein
MTKVERGSMPKTLLKRFLGSMLLIALQACAPGGVTPDPNTINTAIAQTSVALTQTSGPGIPITGDESPTPTPSPLPTATQTPSLTLSPTPIFTFTPVVPLISVSVPTNCRVGPGIPYNRVGALLVGEVAEVVGRLPARNYWIIRNPDRPNETCWLWGEYATVTGNTDVLPIFMPPPSPTPTFTPTPNPSFDAAFFHLESCVGIGWWVDFELENPGGISFNSIALTVRDTVNNTVVSLYADDFTNRDGCNVSATLGNLPAGQELLVSSPIFTTNPSGHELHATITLCSGPRQSGLCTTESITFTP